MQSIYLPISKVRVAIQEQSYLDITHEAKEIRQKALTAPNNHHGKGKCVIGGSHSITGSQISYVTCMRRKSFYALKCGDFECGYLEGDF